MSVFRMKDFEIQQGDVAMKVGTDGTLLGAYVSSWLLSRCCSPSRILDVGTGTGVIALMMAQRFPGAEILGIDIEPGAVQCAGENFDSSPYSSRLRVLRSDFARGEGLRDEPYDLIVSNPPYFDGSTPPPDSLRSIARHHLSLTPEDLIDQATGRLAPSGLTALVLPTEAIPRYRDAAEASGLTLLHRCEVVTSHGKSPKRQIVIWSRLIMDETPVARVTILENGSYTEQYRTLMKDFLTIF